MRLVDAAKRTAPAAAAVQRADADFSSNAGQVAITAKLRKSETRINGTSWNSATAPNALFICAAAL